MWPDRVSNPGPLTALCGPAVRNGNVCYAYWYKPGTFPRFSNSVLFFFFYFFFFFFFLSFFNLCPPVARFFSHAA